jgi:antibiotic biosynthesis monooxygenase (ABM) superfamily enzyme
MTDQAKGLLTAWINMAPEDEEEFNRWYNTEHLQQRVDIPGFVYARRYLSLEGEPKYIALYGLEKADVVYGEAYAQVRENPTPWTRKMESLFQHFDRNIYDEIFTYGESSREGAPYVLTVRVDVSPEMEEEFNAWYEEDHIPALVGVDGVRSARRYRAVEGTPKYLAVFELDNPELLKSEAWSEAREYGRTSQIRPHLQDLRRNVGKLLLQINK